MRMHFIALIVLLLFQLASVAQEQPSQYDFTYAKWETLAFGDGSKEELVDAFGRLSNAWGASGQIERAQTAHYFALAAVTTARQASKEDAFRILNAAGKVVKEYPIILSRGKSAKRFEEVASVHARVWGASGSDPFEGVALGYEMSYYGKNFIALQESAEIDQAVTAEAESLREKNEKLGLLLSLSADGSILKKLPVMILEGSGSLRSRLKALIIPEPVEGHNPSRFTRQAVEVLFPIINSKSSYSAPFKENNPIKLKNDSKSIPLILSVTLGGVIILILVCILLKKRQ